MGVHFDGLADHRRILMPDHWPNHPLRKDLPVGGEERAVHADLGRPRI